MLKNNNRSEWATPSFIIPRKDSQVIFISYFRRLNKQVNHTPYHLPHIQDILNKLYNFTYSPTLDLIMGYYNIKLPDVVKPICTITTPFGKYEYNHLPMGVYIQSNLFQDQMITLMDDLYFSEFMSVIFSSLNQDHLRRTYPRSIR